MRLNNVMKPSKTFAIEGGTVMARRDRRRRNGEGKFDGLLDLLEIVIELLAYAPRMIFGMFRLILRLFD